MNGCEHAVQYVYHYLDKELTLARRARIRMHLRRCNDCGGAYEFEAKLKAMIKQKGSTSPPPELFDTLRTLIDEERKNPHPDE